MSYRGGDLELRIPQGLPAASRASRSDQDVVANGWTARPDSRSLIDERSAPIWVDDVVMECCNQAYELASAHRTGEVRLDHLLHALTVVDASLKILEQRGIRAAFLRRDTGARIAADTPLPAGAPPPRRAPELQETLDRASDRAYARRRPISVIDLISVLLQAPRDWPGVDLVHQHTSEWALREASETRERERVRVAAVSQPAVAQGMPDFLSESVWLGNGATQHASVQPPAQIDAMTASEISRGLKSLAERLQAFGQLDVKLGGLERGLAGLSERLSVIERGIEGSTQNHGTSVATIISRLDTVEKAVATPHPVPGLDEHLTALAKAVQEPRAVPGLESLDARLKDLEKLSSENGLLLAVADEHLTALRGQRTAEQDSTTQLRADVSGLSGSLERQRTELLAGFSQTVRESLLALNSRPELAEEIGVRLAQAEAALTRLNGRVVETSQALGRDLTQFHDNLVKVNVNQKTIATGMDQWRVDTTADLTVINDRLEELERTNAKLSQMHETMLASVQDAHQWSTRWRDRRKRWYQAVFGPNDAWLHRRWFARTPASVEVETPAASDAEVKSETSAAATPTALKPVRRPWPSRPRSPEWLNARLAKMRDYARMTSKKTG